MTDKTDSKDVEQWKPPPLPADPMAGWDLMIKQARVLIKSGFLPDSIREPEQAVAIIQAGRELGLGMMQSLRTIHIIKRKVCLSSELMEGLVYQRVPGASIIIIKTTPEICTIRASRPNVEPCEFSFSLEDAERAGLLKKGGCWETYPQIMLQWRCMSRVCKAVFGDAVMGLYTPEEMGAEVNAEGEIVALPEQTEPSRDLGKLEPFESSRGDILYPDDIAEIPPHEEEEPRQEEQQPARDTDITESQEALFKKLEKELLEKFGDEIALKTMSKIQADKKLAVTCLPLTVYNKGDISKMISGLIKALKK